MTSLTFERKETQHIFIRSRTNPIEWKCNVWYPCQFQATIAKMGAADYRLDKVDRNSAVLRIEYAKPKGGGGDRGGGGGGGGRGRDRGGEDRGDRDRY